MELVHLFDKFRAVRGFVFDVDGVLTDNSVHLTESGEYLRTMNVRDGQAIKWALKAGFKIGVITGGRSEGVKKRLTEMGIDEYYSGITDKWPACQSFMQRTGIQPDQLCYVGDDVPDLPVLHKVMLSACPSDAVPEVAAACDYIVPVKGGSGCVRDIIEKVMKVQELWKFDF